MATLAEIESDVHTALKSRDMVAADTLRGLKTRIQNEQIAQGHELNEDEVTVLVSSEVKRRKEAATAFTDGGRNELAEKELAEAEILQKYLPAQVSEEDISKTAQQMAQESGWATKKDFGPAMAALKAKYGASADSSVLAKVLQEILS